MAAQRSITRGAANLHIAQQARQQTRTIEDMLGTSLVDRRVRPLELTPVGKVFLADSRKALAAHHRAIGRTLATARGEIGTLRPRLNPDHGLRHPADAARRPERAPPRLEGRVPRTLRGRPRRLRRSRDASTSALRPGRRCRGPGRPGGHVPLAALVGEHHPLARRRHIQLAELRDEPLELGPGAMASGLHDAILAACRAAGFEPAVDEAASGSTVWGHIAEGRGVAVPAASIASVLARGVVLLALDAPTPP